MVVFEATIYESYGGWVPDNAYHQWAPSAIKKGSYYYLYVPNVGDKSNQGVPPPISTTSRIGVWRSTSAFGPYNYYAADEQKLVDITSDGRLRATLPYGQLGSAAVFTEMSLT